MTSHLYTATPERVLVVTAHPDDLEYTCGGTIARWCAGGAHVHLLVLTAGQAGTGYGGQRGEALAAVRMQETRDAGSILGLTSLEFLDGIDGHLSSHDHQLRKSIASRLADIQADTVITWSPRYNLDALQLSHPDHLACGALTLEAVYPGEHTPERVWLVGDSEASFGVDVSAHWDTARRALLAHASQADEATAQRREARLAATGEDIYTAPGCLIEQFRSVTIDV